MNYPGYPFTPKRFEVRPGVAMSYLDEGPRDGEVVVMLHGNPSWSYLWRHLVRGLCDRYRCIVPDHIGMAYPTSRTMRPTRSRVTTTRCNRAWTIWTPCCGIWASPDRSRWRCTIGAA